MVSSQDGGEQRKGAETGVKAKTRSRRRRAAAEQDHEAAILHAERVPAIADESQTPGEIERQGRDQPKVAPFHAPANAIYFSAENETGRLSRPSLGSPKAENGDQGREIGENASARRQRQIGRVCGVRLKLGLCKGHSAKKSPTHMLDGRNKLARSGRAHYPLT